MRSKMLVAFGLLLGLAVLASGCGTNSNCPTCGTTVGGGYQIIDVVPVPEHNPTGEPGGPLTSFDISWTDSVNHRFYFSDRIGIDVPVMDTLNDVFLYTIVGVNGVSTGTGAGGVSPCVSITGLDIPPLQTAYNASLYVINSGDPSTAGFGNPSAGITFGPDFTRFGCRTGDFNLYGQFGANGNFGGWAGTQCCASRGNSVNPISCPCGEVATADGNFLIVGNSSSSVEVFDLRPTNTDIKNGVLGISSNFHSPIVIASIPTGSSPDFDGQPNGAAPCVAAWTGRAGSDPSCGDDRADEMSFNETSKVLMVDNGDPGQPFVTLIDLSEVIGQTGTAGDALGGPNCFPPDPSLPYNNNAIVNGAGGLVPGPHNNSPKCVIGQIYYDGNTLNSTENDGTFPCPFPSNGFLDKTPVPSGLAGFPCVHDDIAPAGLGGSAPIAGTGLFLTTNPNHIADPHEGTVEVVDPTGFSRCSAGSCPVVIQQLKLQDCMPGGVVQGPGRQFLIGCIDHDGMAFPANEFIYDFTGVENGANPTFVAGFDQVGGVDETWFNPGDQNYYLAARDMPTGPVMGVINAADKLWLMNANTASNSHSISADSSNNHIFIPMTTGGPCGTQNRSGCVAVYSRF